MDDDKICVLCADDTDIAIEGMKRVLSHNEKIKVVGGITVFNQIISKVIEESPDILLLDFKWDHDLTAGISLANQIKIIKKDIYIIGITVHEHLVQKATNEGVDYVVTKDISTKNLIDLILSIRENIICEKKIFKSVDSLQKLPAGNKDFASEHEKLVQNILEYCLAPELNNWQSQVATYNMVERPDIICSNFSSHPFWSTMRTSHNANQIIIQLKNTIKLNKAHLEQIVLSLGGKKGKFGFLIGRDSPSDHFLKSLYYPYSQDEKIILVFCDNDLIEMVKLKYSKNDPVSIIQNKYAQFIRRYSGM